VELSNCGQVNIEAICKKNGLNCKKNGIRSEAVLSKLEPVFIYMGNTVLKAGASDKCSGFDIEIAEKTQFQRFVEENLPYAAFVLGAPLPKVTQPRFLPPGVAKRLADPARVPNAGDFAPTKIEKAQSVYKPPSHIYNDYE